MTTFSTAQILLNLQGDATSGFSGAMKIGLDLTDIELGASDINTGGSGSGGPGGSEINPPPPP